MLEFHNIGFLCTPQTVGDFEDLLDLGIKEVKISSDNLRNEALLKAVSKSGLPVILSTGMSEYEDLYWAWKQIKNNVRTIMVCVSEYPCSPDSVNISRLNLMGSSALEMFHETGFSDHTQGNTAAVMAVALGATVIEKHFTLDNSLEGPDHWWAADPEQLKSYIGEIRLAEKMLGDGEFKPTEKELELKEVLGR